MKSVTSNRPLRELVAEAKAEVMEEIEDNREEGEEDETMELSVVTNLVLFPFFLSCALLALPLLDTGVAPCRHTKKMFPDLVLSSRFAEISSLSLLTVASGQFLNLLFVGLTHELFLFHPSVLLDPCFHTDIIYH